VLFFRLGLHLRHDGIGPVLLATDSAVGKEVNAVKKKKPKDPLSVQLGVLLNAQRGTTKQKCAKRFNCAVKGRPPLVRRL
jgi:hypothetical protein